jgi:hypothetical protein
VIEIAHESALQLNEITSGKKPIAIETRIRAAAIVREGANHACPMRQLVCVPRARRFGRLQGRGNESKVTVLQFDTALRRRDIFSIKCHDGFPTKPEGGIAFLMPQGR